MPTTASLRPAPATIGVIANPVSARDIRRIVADAGNLQIADRVNIVLRMLAGAAACGAERVLMMPDRSGLRALLERHLRRSPDSRRACPPLEFLDLRPSSTVDDTLVATRLLARAGVRALVVLGGDGTHRAVVRALADEGARIPIAGLSTGTNNAFPELREPTITGMAVGLVAAGRIADGDALAPNKRIDVDIVDAGGDVRHDVAIVDAAITHDHNVGARALWKTESLAAAYFAFAEPQAIGLSAIGGLLHPIGRRDPGGLAVRLARDAHEARCVLHAPLLPGRVLPVPIAGWQRMTADHPHAVAVTAGTVALDGERELTFEAGERVHLTLREQAFFTVDVSRCMAVAAERGLLRRANAAMAADLQFSH